jgi:hypothetical protein
VLRKTAGSVEQEKFACLPDDSVTRLQEQLFIFLGDQRQSGGAFIAVLTEGPKGHPIPPAFSREAHGDLLLPVRFHEDAGGEVSAKGSVFANCNSVF